MLDLGVRLTIFHSFGPHFDKYLIQPDFVELLFLFLRDDSFEVETKKKREQRTKQNNKEKEKRRTKRRLI